MSAHHAAYAEIEAAHMAHKVLMDKAKAALPETDSKAFLGISQFSTCRNAEKLAPGYFVE